MCVGDRLIYAARNRETRQDASLCKWQGVREPTGVDSRQCHRLALSFLNHVPRCTVRMTRRAPAYRSQGRKTKQDTRSQCQLKVWVRWLFFLIFRVYQFVIKQVGYSKDQFHSEFVFSRFLSVTHGCPASSGSMLSIMLFVWVFVCEISQHL